MFATAVPRRGAPMNEVVRRILEPGAPGVGGRIGSGAREGVAQEDAPQEEPPRSTARRARSCRTEASIRPGDWLCMPRKASRRDAAALSGSIGGGGGDGPPRPAQFCTPSPAATALLPKGESGVHGRWRRGEGEKERSRPRGMKASGPLPEASDPPPRLETCCCCCCCCCC